MVRGPTWWKKMYAATLQSEPDQSGSQSNAKAIHVAGSAEIGFVHSDGITRLDHLYQHDPVRVLFPDPPEGDIPQATLITTSGGLTGGDQISLQIKAGPGARAMAIAQAAEKIYRSAGGDTQINLTLGAAADSWLEYLPQETILFDGARLSRLSRVQVTGSAQLLAGEIIVFGRRGSGEIYGCGYLRDAWEIYRDETLVWADAVLLEDDISGPLNHPAGFDGAAAMATAVYSGPDAATYLDPTREILNTNPDGVRSSATMVNDLLIVRWLGEDALSLRTVFGNFWQQFRHQAAVLPASLPRLWHM